MALAVAPRSAPGRWSLVFAAVTVVETLAAWIANLPFLGLPSADWARLALGQAFIAPATAAAALGLVGILHHRERSAVTWATTLAALALAAWVAWLILNAAPRY